MTPNTGCTCGFPAKWAADPNFPVEFDPKTYEFSIHDKSGKAWRMRYCFWCGGVLHRLKTDEPRATMDPEEVKEVRAVIERIHSVAEMKEVLGEPDREVEGTPVDPAILVLYGGEAPARRWYQYYKRWRTVCLSVGDLGRGRIEASYAGRKPKSVL